MKANNTVGIGTSAFTFTCTQDSNVSLHSYPRKDKENPGSDPAYNTTLGVESVGTTTSFTLNVGKSQSGDGGELTFNIVGMGTGYVNPVIHVDNPAYANLGIKGLSRLGLGDTTSTGIGLSMTFESKPSSAKPQEDRFGDAASLIRQGVIKSGSPIPKLITSSRVLTISKKSLMPDRGIS